MRAREATDCKAHGRKAPSGQAGEGEARRSEEITDDGWKELIELELDERMTETDIKHLRRLCEAEMLLLLEHFGHSNYDEVTVKQRLKMPKLLSYTETSSADQAEKPSRKSSFRKFSKAKKKKVTIRSDACARKRMRKGVGKKRPVRMLP